MAPPRSNTTARLGAAAAALLAAAALAGCGAGGTGTTTAVQPPTSAPPPTAEPEARCSASGLSADLSDQGLPGPVEELRARIAAAAVACDYAALAAIARANPDGFSFTFGGGTDPATHWRRLEQRTDDRPMERLVRILALPFTRNTAAAYAWPSAYTEQPTEADWLALVDVYPPDELELMRQAGGYLGYRTAISPDGNWLFFVAGD